MLANTFLGCLKAYNSFCIYCPLKLLWVSYYFLGREWKLHAALAMSLSTGLFVYFLVLPFLVMPNTWLVFLIWTKHWAVFIALSIVSTGSHSWVVMISSEAVVSYVKLQLFISMYNFIIYLHWIASAILFPDQSYKSFCSSSQSAGSLTTLANFIIGKLCCSVPFFWG